MTPKKIDKFSQGVIPCCKRCGEEKADDIHMFASCPKLVKNWHNVGQKLSDILNTNIKVSQQLIFFGMDSRLNLPITKPQKELLFYIILLARRQICCNWISAQALTESSW